MKHFFSQVMTAYVRFAEKQGFPIIVTVCVGVIAATALWTGRQEPAYVSPTPPVDQSISAAQLLQQSLRSTVTPAPAVTAEPRVWAAPLSSTEPLRPFSADTFHQGSETSIWQLHDAVDLACDPGDKICAISDGQIIRCGQDDLLGVWVHVDHGDGIQALYAGMALSGAYLPGDQVDAGATLGFAGKGPLDEQDMPPHLHLRVTQDGRAIDPADLWAH